MKDYDHMLERIYDKAEMKIETRKRNKRIAITTLSSLCLIAIISITAVVAAPQYFKNSSNDIVVDGTKEPSSMLADQELNTTIPEDIDTSLKGLEVVNHGLPDESELGVSSDRILVRSIPEFFVYTNIDAIAIIRVLDTKQWLDRSEFDSTLRQNSYIKVISTVWANGSVIPDAMTVNQALYGGCMGDEETNLLRKGGVYLVPITKSGDKWYIYYDMDVLFEVDQEERVWSHSIDKGFNSYDGKLITELSSDIIELTSQENFEELAKEWYLE